MRTVLRGLGQTLITLGAVVLLFVVYEVYVTDLFGHQKQAAATSAIDEVWAEEQPAAETVVVQSPDQLVTDPRQRVPSYEPMIGEGFAKLYVPAFGADYVFTVVEGTDPDDLYIGPGHYSDTQLPGQPGNFAVAGHRVSKGSPFNDLGLLASCDAVVVETQDDWFVYRVLPMAQEVAGWAATTRAHCDGVGVQTGQYDGVYGREITAPADYAQVLPVPHITSTDVPADAQRMITLTTCHPQFSDAERMIIHGVLAKSYAKSPGFLPPELSEA
jgi:sortase (surface protein transpeptidase)